MMWIIVFLLFAILCTLMDMNEKKDEEDEFYWESDEKEVTTPLLTRVKSGWKDFVKDVREMP